MPIGLNDGSSFRLVNAKNQDITTNPKTASEGVKLQIDTDKDGNFNGAKDIEVFDKTQISLLLDNIKGNAKVLDNIPFVNEIEEHLSKTDDISNLLSKAATVGHQAEGTSIFNMDKKIALGKEAIQNVQKAFNTDKANPEARFAYGVSLIKIQESTFKSTAESKLGINLNQMTKGLISELSKEKFNISNLLVLKKLYEVTSDSSAKHVEEQLKQLKAKSPAEYNAAVAKFEKAID